MRRTQILLPAGWTLEIDQQVEWVVDRWFTGPISARAVHEDGRVEHFYSKQEMDAWVEAQDPAARPRPAGT